MAWWQGLEEDLIQRLPFPRKYRLESLNRGDEHHGVVVAISPHYVAKIFQNSNEGFRRARMQADAHLLLADRMNVPELAAYYEIDHDCSIHPVLLMERILGVVVADLRPPHDNLDSPDYREYLRVYDLYKREVRKALELGADIPYMKPQNARYLPENDEVWITDLSSCYFFTDQTKPRSLPTLERKFALSAA